MGARGTAAATLYQIYEMTRSLSMTGMIGLAQAAALLGLGGLGGALADRVDRRRLLQCAQATSLIVALGLTAVTFSGHVQVWHILVCVLLTTAAATFDQPARLALIPAMVPREELPQAFALLSPSREIAVLLGPAISGLLIAIAGPGLVYAVDAATCMVLVLVLEMLRIPALVPTTSADSVWENIREGMSFLRRRPLIYQMMSLDICATFIGAYRVVLPALALDILHVGPSGYGVLSAAPSAGALLSAWKIFRVVGHSHRLGRVLLWATIGYGVAIVGLAQAPAFGLALLAGTAIGAFDTAATTIRQAAVQLETPDHLRGRISSLYQIAARGGPSLGNLYMGWLTGLLGPAVGLTIGGLGVIAYTGLFLSGGVGRVRNYGRAEAVASPSQADVSVSTVDPHTVADL